MKAKLIQDAEKIIKRMIEQKERGGGEKKKEAPLLTWHCLEASKSKGHSPSKTII